MYTFIYVTYAWDETKELYEVYDKRAGIIYSEHDHEEDAYEAAVVKDMEITREIVKRMDVV